jgi:hypothetical protein
LESRQKYSSYTDIILAGFPIFLIIQPTIIYIGFWEAGSCMLASPNGKNIMLELLSPMDDKEGKTLCQTMRKQGGGRLGIYVSTLAEVTIKTVCYIACHFNWTSCSLAVAHITLANIFVFANHHKAEDVFK